MSVFDHEDFRGVKKIVSDRDVILESDRDQDGDGDLIFRSGGVERARINHAGVGSGWGTVLANLLPVNVKTYGAKGDGVTDDTAAFTTAYVASTTGVIYCPSGTYKLGSALAFAPTATKPLTLIGDGASTVLAPAFTSGDAITVTGDNNARVNVKNLSISPSVTRDQLSYNLTVVGASDCVVDGVSQIATGGSLFQFDTVNYLEVANCRGRSSGAQSGIALRIKACNGSPRVTNSRFETAAGVSTGYTGCKPALYVTGNVTGLGFGNCVFTGAGPRSQWTVSGITSDATKFTVTTTAAHDFRVGDFVVLRGMTPSAYNSMWRVATVPTTTTFTVTTTANSGTSTVNGTAESVAACAYISNEDSGSPLSVNESHFTGCLFEAGQTGLYGSAGLYLDGRRGTYPTGTQSGGISGWTLTGNYYDQYHIGCLISGQASNAANETTVNGININGGAFNARGRGVHIEQAQSVTLDGGPVLCVPGSVTPINDGVSNSAAVYVYAGPAAPFTRGISIGSGFYGMGRNQQATNNTPYAYGLLIDSTGIDLLSVKGGDFFGSTAGIGEVNSPLTGANRHWAIDPDSCSGGATFPPSDAELLPSVASAATVALTNVYQKRIKITGTTNISTINSTWHGREIHLLFTGALSLVTGGNLAIAANKTVAAGDVVTLVYDTATPGWYVK